MSDSPQALSPAPDAAPVLERGLVKTEPPIATLDAWLALRTWVLVAGVLAVIGVLSSIFLWQKLSAIQEELARRSTDSSAQSIEARTLARAAQEGTRELAARLATQESRISEVSLQRAQLEELMQNLSRSRDENLVVDLESDLRLAQQQAQLTGSAAPLLAALKTADQRLQRAAQPRLNPLQRAIVRDVDRIKSASITDVPSLVIKLDELVRLVDDLPVANAMVTNNVLTAPVAAPQPARRAASQATGNAAAATDDTRFNLTIFSAWSERVLDTVWDEAQKLLRVSRIDHPEAALLAPEQTFFLRENLKLRLLNARLGLLSRQTDTTRSDLLLASSWLNRYFDPNSRRTQTATQLLAQVQSQLKTSELPRLDDTLAAIATASAGR